MDELTTSIVGIDFPNEDMSQSNRQMECMMCARVTRWNCASHRSTKTRSPSVANRGTQLGYVSAEHAPLIFKRIKEDGASAPFQACAGPKSLPGGLENASPVQSNNMLDGMLRDFFSDLQPKFTKKRPCNPARVIW
jgi:hypothetical protein